MAGITPDEGELAQAKKLYGELTAGDYEVLLYTAPSKGTVSDITVLSDLTECAGSGYARVTLAKDTNWTTSQESGTTYATGDECVFEDDGTGDWNDIVGYAIVDTQATPKLIHVEDFDDGPYTVSKNGKVNVTPKIELA